MSEEILPIVNKYALAEELGHLDQSSTSKSNDKKRKSNLFVANVEWLHRNKEYRPRPGEFKDFLDRIYIPHQGKHKTRDCDRL
jgi:hypothetical protein